MRKYSFFAGFATALFVGGALLTYSAKGGLLFGAFCVAAVAAFLLFLVATLSPKSTTAPSPQPPLAVDDGREWDSQP